MMDRDIRRDTRTLIAFIGFLTVSHLVLAALRCFVLFLSHPLPLRLSVYSLTIYQIFAVEMWPKHWFEWM